MDLVPGKDYTVLTISFDPNDSYKLSAKKKNNYFNTLKNKIADEAWTFLTADSISIGNITKSTGFNYRKDGNEFQHPVALIVLAPDGKIIRYLYGTTFLPFDLKMAITEASEGRAGPSINKAIKYCFSYDSKSKKYVFDMLKVAGTLMIALAAGLLFFLARKDKKRDGN